VSIENVVASDNVINREGNIIDVINVFEKFDSVQMNGFDISNTKGLCGGAPIFVRNCASVNISDIVLLNNNM
jgi:hypothetical protein